MSQREFSLTARRARVAASAFAAGLAWSGPGAAHGLGRPLEFDLPLWLWLLAAALSVLLSFALVIDFLPAALARTDAPRRVLVAGPVGPLVRGAVRLLRGLVLAAAIATVMFAFGGSPDPTLNPAPLLLWAVLWVGTGLACALLGDLWALCNPLAILHDLLARLVPLPTPRPWPVGLGAWPAVAGLALVAGFEHLVPGADDPRLLGAAAVFYGLASILAMRCYGRGPWLAQGDVLAVFFGLLARFAPLALERTVSAPCARITCPASHGRCAAGMACGGRGGHPALVLRPPGAGLLGEQPLHPSLVAFLWLFLASVAFDGFTATPAWPALAESLGATAGAALAVPLFLLFPGCAFALYAGCCALMARTLAATRARPGTATLIGRFALTLVPIALAYHFAHYLDLLLAAVDRLPALLRVGAVPDAAAPAAPPWLPVVIAIVLGHVLSVWLAHVTALAVAGSRRAALRLELPLLVLMVAYTMSSLWLLAQPAR